jgi:hypothetical protein
MKLCPTAARALGGWHKTTPRPFLTALLLVILSGCFSSQQAPMLMPPASPGTQQSGGEQTTVTQAAEECVKCGPQAYYKREIENGGQKSCFAALSDSDLGDEMERRVELTSTPACVTQPSSRCSPATMPLISVGSCASPNLRPWRRVRAFARRRPMILVFLVRRSSCSTTNRQNFSA